jgi:hypothetical protein
MGPVGLAMIVAGGLIAVVGLWSAVTGGRPTWMPGRALTPEKARTWGAATALGGAGLLVWGLNLLVLKNSVVQVVATLTILAGAAWVSVMWPNTRRPRRPQ